MVHLEHSDHLAKMLSLRSDVVDARICSVMLMDDSSGVGQLRSFSCMSGSLNPCTHHLALALYPVSVSFQRRTRREEITLFTVFFSDHIHLHGVYDGHRLEIEYSLPFGFNCFRKLRLLFCRQVVLGYLIGAPSTEVKFSMHCVCLGRRNRKGSVFLASSDVEVSSLHPCLPCTQGHREFQITFRSCSD